MLTISAAKLAKALSTAKRFVPSNAITPILENFRLTTDAKAGKLQIRAADMGASLDLYVACAVGADMDVCIPANRLSGLIDLLAKENTTQNIVIKADGPFGVHVLYDRNGKTAIAGQDPNEWLRQNQEKSISVLTVDAETLAGMLGNALLFCAPCEAREPFMDKVTFYSEGDSLFVAALTPNAAVLYIDKFDAYAIDGVFRTYVPDYGVKRILDVLRLGQEKDVYSLSLHPTAVRLQWLDSEGAILASVFVRISSTAIADDAKPFYAGHVAGGKKAAFTFSLPETSFIVQRCNMMSPNYGVEAGANVTHIAPKGKKVTLYASDSASSNSIYEEMGGGEVLHKFAEVCLSGGLLTKCLSVFDNVPLTASLVDFGPNRPPMISIAPESGYPSIYIAQVLPPPTA